VVAQHTTLVSSAPWSSTTRETSLTQVAPKVTTPATTGSSTRTSAVPTRLASAGGGDGGQSTTSGSGLSGGAKIAIGVCSGLALVTLISVALLCLYRRKRRRTHLGLAKNIPSSGSPTPLISTTNSAASGGAPLTPPLRLRDRRFLPSILRPGNRSPSPPLTPLTPAYGGYSPHHRLHPSSGGVFPSSPICSPTTNKLVPRHEKTPRVNGASLGIGASESAAGILPPSAFALPALPGTATSRGSLSSYGGASSTTGHSSLRHEVAPQLSAGNDSGSSTGPEVGTGAGTATGVCAGAPPSFPNRPPRPHDAPLEIPDLVSPASPLSPLSAVSASTLPLGPPSNRALPPPPPPPPFLAGEAGAGNTASFTAVGGRSLIPRGVTVLREWEGEGEGEGNTEDGRPQMRDDEDGDGDGGEYKYEGGDGYVPRGSWGSWSGTISGSGPRRPGERDVDG